MRTTSRIDVDLGAITRNLRYFQRLVGPSRAVCPVVKADAYGLGASRIARTLVGAGADMLAVYSTDQAASLLQTSVGVPILVLMPVDSLERTDEVYRGFVCGRLHITIHDREHLAIVRAFAAKLGAVLPVHVEVDTGMRRGGCRVEEAPALIRDIHADRRLRLAGMFTHFASAETDPEFTQSQHEAFAAVIDATRDVRPSGCLIHEANTVAALRDGRHHRSMIRIGQGWAGYGDEWIDSGCGEAKLEPSVRWVSQLVQVKDVEVGETVGYRGLWKADRPSRIALIPVGYADGYPQALGTRSDREPARVGVRTSNGERAWAPVVGAVSMDQITVDVTGIDVDRGAEVELIGSDRTAPTHLPRLATLAGSSPYELLCRLRESIPRRYIAPARVSVEVRSAQVLPAIAVS